MQARTTILSVRKGAAAEGMILQIIPGRADKIRTTVASFAESYGINCLLVLCTDIFIPIAGRTLRRLFYYLFMHLKSIFKRRYPK